VTFESFSFHPQIHAGIIRAGYDNPTEIQAQTIPAVLAGRDVLGLAQTGTGKTAAFALPILERLMTGPRKKLRALVLSPTRELAEQTHAAFAQLGQKTDLRSLTLYGGVGIQPQINKLRAGAEIAVACPGRLLDLMSQRAVRLDAIEILVIDEADRMFDMGFLPDIRRIAAALPRSRQTLLYSATMPAEIRSLASDFLHQPVSVEIRPSRPVETVSHAMYAVEQTRKTDLLAALLHQTGSGQVLIFTRTKHRANKLAGQLVKAGFSATSLQGNLSQSRRQEAMEGFRKGRYQIMVATDIASRGIDVTQITHVINFDLPDTAEAYTHRIGRTGRMTRLGTALSLVTEDDVDMLLTIERLLGSRLERRFMEGFELAPGRKPQSAPAFQPERSRYRDQANRPRRRFEPTPSPR
jgi:ATP-dependent RNA helicase RhlE